MYQHVDLLAAQSMARERERDLRESLRSRRLAADRAPAQDRPVVGRSRRLRDLLVRAHLVHAPSR